MHGEACRECLASLTSLPVASPGLTCPYLPDKRTNKRREGKTDRTLEGTWLARRFLPCFYFTPSNSLLQTSLLHTSFLTAEPFFWHHHCLQLAPAVSSRHLRLSSRPPAPFFIVADTLHISREGNGTSLSQWLLQSKALANRGKGSRVVSSIAELRYLDC